MDSVTFLMTWVEALHITYSLMLILLSVFLSKPLQGWKCSGGMLVSGMFGPSSSGAIFSGSSQVDSSCRLSSIVVPSLLSVKIQTQICYQTLEDCINQLAQCSYEQTTRGGWAFFPIKPHLMGTVGLTLKADIRIWHFLKILKILCKMWENAYLIRRKNAFWA